MTKDVEGVTASLVREYLNRKGLKETLACMDKEHPRTQSSINKRADLRRILYLDALCRKNKSQPNPLKSMLEIIVKQQLDMHGDLKTSFTSDQREPVLPRSQSEMSVIKAGDVFDEERARERAESQSCKVFNSKRELSSETPKLEAKTPVMSTFPQPEREVHPGPFSQQSSYTQSSGKTIPPSDRSITDFQKIRPSRVARGMMAGPIASSTLNGTRKRQSRQASGTSVVQPQDGEGKLCLSTQSCSMEDTSRDQPAQTAFEMEVEKLKGDKPKSLRIQTELINTGGSSEFELLNTGCGRRDRPGRKQRAELLAKGVISAVNVNMDCLDINDIVDEEELGELSTEALIPSATHNATDPMDQNTAVTLKRLLFGSSMSCFSKEWKEQSFTFSDVPDLRYGIVQKRGGPCGVLASVQACVLQNLLFEEIGGLGCQKLRPSNCERSRCLSMAISEILWRAGEGRRAVVAILSAKKHFTPAGQYKSDGILEMITTFKAKAFEELRLHVQQHIHQFESGPSGCVLLTISAILSRSVEMVREDFDVPTNTLIGAHGYCTQELINLLLCGQALSNVFDNDLELNSGNGNITTLKGIKERSDIGLLSLFEHYNICKVGTYLKTPRYPIWLVCSESHFSVLFCTRKELISDWRMESKFDLYYYDGLANQQEEIVLTICTGTSNSYADDIDVDLIPPLEHCIRTKWSDATVDWNKTEPIL